MMSHRSTGALVLRATAGLAAGLLITSASIAEILDAMRAELALEQYAKGQASAPMRDSYEAERGQPWTKGARIFGGTDVPKNSRPWQVALLRSWTASNLKAQFCGGSYVGGKVVVTAAHCVDDGTTKDSVDVLVGTTDLTSGGRRVKVTSIVPELRYKAKNYDHDIALLILDVSDAQLAQLGKMLQKIDLITANQANQHVAPGNTVAATGWGRTEDGDLVVAKLREVQLPVVGYDVCNDISGYDGQLTASMFCAGGYSDMNTCTGDSGGPLSVAVGQSSLLAGVTSAGARGLCGEPGRYGVYTRVGDYRDWIKAAIDGKK